MIDTLLVYKHIGQTPLEIVQKVKMQFPDLDQAVISYAGRLDPMAEGLLLLLINEENKNRKKYENLQKVYEVEILLGVSTDSYDLLGKIVDINNKAKFPIEQLTSTILSFKGKHEFPYPPYSSKPVNGKALYYWARRNLLQTVKIPTKEITISSITIDSLENLSGAKITAYAISHITKVLGDFRQGEISNDWQTFQKAHSHELFQAIKLTVSCSSGTYMRTLAHLMGERLGIPSLAFSIKRIAIGDKTLDNCIYLDE